MILKTQSTAIGDNVALLAETTLLDKQVLTQAIKLSLSLRSTGVERLAKILKDSSRAT